MRRYHRFSRASHLTRGSKQHIRGRIPNLILHPLGHHSYIFAVARRHDIVLVHYQVPSYCLYRTLSILPKTWHTETNVNSGRNTSNQGLTTYVNKCFFLHHLTDASSDIPQLVLFVRCNGLKSCYFPASKPPRENECAQLFRYKGITYNCLPSKHNLARYLSLHTCNLYFNM